MALRPHIRISVNAFLVETWQFSAEETGAYMLLALHFGWHRSLPSDDRALAKIVRMPVVGWRKIKEHILPLTEKWGDFLEFKGTGAIWEAVIANPRPPQEVWRELRAIVFERDGYACTYCGDIAGPFECDHINPVARGGPSTLENLTTSCFTCNRSKRDKTVEEWLG